MSLRSRVERLERMARRMAIAAERRDAQRDE